MVDFDHLHKAELHLHKQGPQILLDEQNPENKHVIKASWTQQRIQNPQQGEPRPHFLEQPIFPSY
jgi:hypothetical protein